jgi:hypothetical protein
MASTRSRRRFLAAVGVVGLAGVAGCVGGSRSSRGATDVIVHNVAEVSRTVEVTVTQADSTSPNIDTRFDLPPHSKRKINNEVLMDSDYDVEVSFTDETRDSAYSETQAWDDAGKALHVMLNNQIVFTVQIG